MYLSGMNGLGDNFYQRAVVRELGALSLITPWPQLYADLPEVKCVRPFTRLRTQAKNVARTFEHWHEAPAEHVKTIRYDGSGTMLESMMGSVGLDLPIVNFDGPPVAKTNNRPYIVIRPATLRGEWMAAARNPKSEYLCRVAEALRDDFDIISVADLDSCHEYAVDPLPFADETYHHGELAIEDLLELVGNASGIVGGVGWALPASIAYKVPMMLLYGGWGHVNGPNHTMDRRIDSANVHHVFPDRFCMCNDRAHECNKTISDLDEKIDRFRIRLAQDASMVA